MKRVLGLAGFCALLGAATMSIRADDAPAKPPTVLPLDPKTPVPTLQIAPAAAQTSTPTDSPDFSPGDSEQQVIQQLAEARQEKSEAADLKAFDLDQQQKAYDDDWMLRDYAAALKKQGMAKSPQTDPSLLPHPDDPLAKQRYVDPLLATPPEKKRTATERHHAADTGEMTQLAPTKSIAPLTLQPLLAPLARPAGKLQHDPWIFAATTADDNALPDADTTPSPERARNRSALSSDTSMNSLLDSPGFTAQHDGLTTAADLSLQDALPQEDPVRPKVKNSRDNFLVPTAPTNDVSEFFKKQAAAFQPPTAPNAILPPIVAAKPFHPAETFPLAKPVSNPGMHSRVADPFDILNR